MKALLPIAVSIVAALAVMGASTDDSVNAEAATP